VELMRLARLRMDKTSAQQLIDSLDQRLRQAQKQLQAAQGPVRPHQPCHQRTTPVSLLIPYVCMLLL
jgi:hypothetical protein